MKGTILNPYLFRKREDKPVDTSAFLEKQYGSGVAAAYYVGLSKEDAPWKIINETNSHFIPQLNKITMFLDQKAAELGVLLSNQPKPFGGYFSDITSEPRSIKGIERHVDEGKKYLEGIASMLADPNISDSRKKSVLSNLIDKLHVCGPGMLTAIETAYFSLRDNTQGLEAAIPNLVYQQYQDYLTRNVTTFISYQGKYQLPIWETHQIVAYQEVSRSDDFLPGMPKDDDEHAKQIIRIFSRDKLHEDAKRKSENFAKAVTLSSIIEPLVDQLHEEIKTAYESMDAIPETEYPAEEGKKHALIDAQLKKLLSFYFGQSFEDISVPYSYQYSDSMSENIVQAFNPHLSVWLRDACFDAMVSQGHFDESAFQQVGKMKSIQVQPKQSSNIQFYDISGQIVVAYSDDSGKIHRRGLTAILQGLPPKAEPIYENPRLVLGAIEQQDDIVKAKICVHLKNAYILTPYRGEVDRILSSTSEEPADRGVRLIEYLYEDYDFTLKEEVPQDLDAFAAYIEAREPDYRGKHAWIARLYCKIMWDADDANALQSKLVQRLTKAKSYTPLEIEMLYVLRDVSLTDMPLDKFLSNLIQQADLSVLHRFHEHGGMVEVAPLLKPDSKLTRQYFKLLKSSNQLETFFRQIADSDISDQHRYALFKAARKVDQHILLTVDTTRLFEKLIPRSQAAIKKVFDDIVHLVVPELLLTQEENKSLLDHVVDKLVYLSGYNTGWIGKFYAHIATSDNNIYADSPHAQYLQNAIEKKLAAAGKRDFDLFSCAIHSINHALRARRAPESAKVQKLDFIAHYSQLNLSSDAKNYLLNLAEMPIERYDHLRSEVIAYPNIIDELLAAEAKAVKSGGKLGAFINMNIIHGYSAKKNEQYQKFNELIRRALGWRDSYKHLSDCLAYQAANDIKDAAYRDKGILTPLLRLVTLYQASAKKFRDCIPLAKASRDEIKGILRLPAVMQKIGSLREIPETELSTEDREQLGIDRAYVLQARVAYVSAKIAKITAMKSGLIKWFNIAFRMQRLNKNLTALLFQIARLPSDAQRMPIASAGSAPVSDSSGARPFEQAQNHLQQQPVRRQDDDREDDSFVHLGE